METAHESPGRPAQFDLWTLAMKAPFPDDVVQHLAGQILPG